MVGEANVQLSSEARNLGVIMDHHMTSVVLLSVLKYATFSVFSYTDRPHVTGENVKSKPKSLKLTIIALSCPKIIKAA